MEGRLPDAYDHARRNKTPLAVLASPGVVRPDTLGGSPDLPHVLLSVGVPSGVRPTAENRVQNAQIVSADNFDYLLSFHSADSQGRDSICGGNVDDAERRISEGGRTYAFRFFRINGTFRTIGLGGLGPSMCELSLVHRLAWGGD